MLTTDQLPGSSPTWRDERVESAIALATRDSRPNSSYWQLAHPYRYIEHQREIHRQGQTATGCAAREALIAVTSCRATRATVPDRDAGGE